MCKSVSWWQPLPYVSNVLIIFPRNLEEILRKHFENVQEIWEDFKEILGKINHSSSILISLFKILKKYCLSKILEQFFKISGIF